MQDFFFVGLIGAVALGVLLIKSILFVITMINLKQTNHIIETNLSNVKVSNHQTQQIQNTVNVSEAVASWRVEDPRLVEDLRLQFLTKTKTRRTPSSGRGSPREKVPLATTDFDTIDDIEDAVPIYTYNPNIGGTQV